MFSRIPYNGNDDYPISIDLFNSAIVEDVLSSVDIETFPKHVIDYKDMLNKDSFN